jgi:hypothetical protein
MGERNRWFPVVAILSLAGIGVVAPALARDSANTFGMAGLPSSFAIHTARPFMRNSNVMPHIVARNADLRNDLRLRRHALFQNAYRLRFGHIRHLPTQRLRTFLRAKPLLPHLSFVMSGLPNDVPEPQAPETPPDYGFVAGCRAIPNGHHCDTPHNATVAP